MSLFRSALESPWLWGLMALLPLAVLALYFLKLKREPVEVPSTYLWKKSIEDLHVNSLWQKLRQSLLLFLQLLLLALAILALLRPGWEGDRLEGQRFIFVIDNSASMGSKDIEDAESRLDAAKKHVIGLVDQMESGMQALVISFNDEARVVQGFTGNRGKLREAVEKITLTSHTTDLRSALELADGLASPGQNAEGVETPETSEQTKADKSTLYIFSDGRFAGIEEFTLDNLEPQIYVPIGKSDASNLAITAFSTRQSESRPDARQAFAQVSNYSSEPQKVVLEISHDGNFLDAEELEVPAGESRGVTFALSDVPAGKLEAKLASSSLTEAKDTLALDNRATAAVNDSAAGRILLATPGNKLLTTALATGRIKRYGDIEIVTPATLATKEHQELADSGAYDLIIYDQCAPAERMPRANTLFIGTVPPTWLSDKSPTVVESAAVDKADDKTEKTETEKPAEKPDTKPAIDRVNNPQIIDQAREHPLMAYVDLSDIFITASNLVPPSVGGQVLAESTDGPVLSIAPREGFEDAVLGFEISINKDGGEYANTNWYRRYSFPTFLLNVISYFVGEGQEGIERTHLPGKPLALRTKSLAKELVVTGPNGLRRTVARNEDGSYLFQETDEPGYYEILDGDEVQGRFVVNLFDPQESAVQIETQGDENSDDKIESPASLKIGHVEVEAQGARPARQELWRPILLLVAGVLLFEWYIYNRRVYL
ncbi:vWA domain-containing protein [Aeoliella sp. SH292]|uniref:vWA domain-containing protein n=1 Tax=Aeoliella sp. SH292 TaxID=3454464 RepID=UPI003F9E0149